MKKSALFVALIIICSCANNSPDDLNPTGNNSIRLKWFAAHDGDLAENGITGLQWTLSYLGGRLTSSPVAIREQGDMIIVDPDALGLDPVAAANLAKLHKALRESGEYSQKNYIDGGRYVALLLGSAPHYYAITGVPENINLLLLDYEIGAEKGYVNNSGVSMEHRKISFSEQNGLHQVFISEESDPVTGEIYEYETLELMPNGQVRFGIFDSNGNRKNSADPLHSNAGKPAKCMWCHESKINQMFTPQQDFSGFLTYLQLQDKLVAFNENFMLTRQSLNGGVDFSQLQQHTQAEIMYISFMEPSAERLAMEWEMTVAAVQELLSDLPTHQHDEFPEFGTLYHRHDVEQFAPFEALPASSSVREESAIEVNHIQ